MGNLRRTFVSGRIEKDTDERLLQDGEYRHAENILILESEGSDAGAIQNSLSNRKLTNLNLGPNPITLGTGADETNKKLYWAVKSDTGCFFIEYDVVNSIAVKVLEDTRSIPGRVLDWKEDYLITAMTKVVTSDPSKDLMIINDDNLEPLCFNIARAKTYGTNGFDKEDIFLIKKPPRFSPKVQPTFIAGSSNDIEERFLTFSYKYKYLDGEYSALSSYTNYMFYPGAFKLDYEVLDNLGMLNAYNALRITINTGDKRVTDVECAVKSVNSNNIYIIQTFNKEKEGWGHNETRSFVFSNNKIYVPYPEKEIYRAYDNIPRKAKAQTLIGNLLVMGNFLEGYDLIDLNGQKIKPEFNLSIVSDNLVGSLVPVTLATSGSIAGDILVIDFTDNNLKNGSKITVFASLKSTTTPETEYNQDYPFTLYKDYVDATELAQDEDFIFFVNDLMTNLFLANYSVVGLDDYVLQSNTPFSIQSFTATSISIQSPQLVFYKAGPPADTIIVYWPFQSDSNVLYNEIGNVSSLKSNRSLEVGIIYLDPFNRASTVQTQLNNTIFIDHSLAKSKNKLKINLSSNPPASADRYKFVIKQRKLAYQTVYATIFYADGLFRWIKMENDNYDKVAVGDNLIVKCDTDGFVPTLTKLKVLEKTAQPKDFIEGNVDPDGNEIKELAGNYIKVKPSAGIAMNYAPGGFLEYTGQRQSEGDNFDMAIGAFADSDGVDIPIKQGSRIDILLENVKYGSSGDSKKFEKTYFASADYINFKLWYDTEVSGTGEFNYPTNGVFRGKIITIFGAKFFVEDPAGKLYLRIHNELNGNGQHPSYLTGSVNIMVATSLIILETEEKKSTDNEVYFETEQTFEIIDGKHQGNLQNQTSVLPAIIDLDFFNCFCMGNGAESYVIKDAFNKEYLNVDLRPSVATIEQYKAIRRSSDLIFSEAFIESSNINGLNVFNTATGNFKELDKQYGSIQKLHSRDNDILILKERKASKVMFQKDILYNVDGTSNVGSIDKTLGSEITYLGSNGIGKHPESFAENNYQIYYANPEQGEITRLSIDGTTPITNGMVDWWRDILRNQPNAKMLGGYDGYTKQYMISIGEEPERLLQLQCSNEIIKDNQQGSFTYEFKLNDLSGDIILNYNITAGNATIVARFNEVDHVSSNVTGLGNITFERTSLVQNIVTVTITATTAAVSYSIGNVCPIGSELKIVSIIVNDSEDVGKNTTTRFKWGTSNLYSNDDVFDNTPVSKFLTETGTEGVGKFPLNNSIFTIQAFKDMTTSGEFSIEECNRMGFLISDAVFTEANIDTILSAATFISIASLVEPGYSDTKFGSFLFNRSDTDEILYLIWDYTNRKPILTDDNANAVVGGSVTVNVLSNDEVDSDDTVTIFTAPLHGVAVVNIDKTITYTHDGSANYDDVIVYKVDNGTCSSTASIFISLGVPCSASVTAGGSTGIYESVINIGTAMGMTGIKYDAQSVPDRFEIYFDNVKVADSKYVGDGLSAGPPVSYAGLLGPKTGFHIFNYNGSTFDDTGLIEPDFTVVQGDIADNTTEATDGNGTLLFNKTSPTPTTMKIRTTGTSGTAWTFAGVCPIPEENLKIGNDKIVWGFYDDANKASLAKTKSMKFFLQTTPLRFYTNIKGDTDFVLFAISSTNKFINDGVTWWEIDNLGNILSTGTI
ncbi:Ig-like domain-containing protein [Flavobacterium sp. FlaQc-50]|uniref:Ig-like domain-containing protein n=1 Tax=unclassified Flavobacterium TaxID=196869 RepID=UPI00375681EC